MKVPNTITMTVELCAEDRARLDNILAALTAGGHACKCAETPAPAAEAAPAPETAPAVEVYTPEAESPAAAAEEPKTEAKYVPTIDELQSKVMNLITAGKKAEVREIVKSYAVKVSDIPEDKRAEAWERLTALEV